MAPLEPGPEVAVLGKEEPDGDAFLKNSFGKCRELEFMKLSGQVQHAGYIERKLKSVGFMAVRERVDGRAKQLGPSDLATHTGRGLNMQAAHGRAIIEKETMVVRQIPPT